MSEIPAPPERWLYHVPEAERLLGVSHATLYRLIRDGRLRALKIGARTAIPADSIREFIAALPAADVA